MSIFKTHPMTSIGISRGRIDFFFPGLPFSYNMPLVWFWSVSHLKVEKTLCIFFSLFFSISSICSLHIQHSPSLITIRILKLHQVSFFFYLFEAKAYYTTFFFLSLLHPPQISLPFFMHDHYNDLTSSASLISLGCGYIFFFLW